MELWKTIEGFEAYSISNKGRCKSFYKNPKGTILKPLKGTTGYFTYDLRSNGVRKMCKTHLLVLTSFKGERKKGEVGCHNDGDKGNNNLTNLRWDTRSNNELDKRSHNTDNRGEKHYGSKLTGMDVLKIRNLHEQGFSNIEIAKLLKFKRQNVCAVTSRRTWKHIK